jgi:amino acid permease
VLCALLRRPAASRFALRSRPRPSRRYITLHFTSSRCLEDLIIEGGSKRGFNMKQRVVEVVCYLGVTVGTAMFVKELDVVLGVMGSCTVIPFMFVIPGLLQLQLDKDSKQILSIKSRASGWMLIILGCILSVAGLYVTIAAQ